MAHAIVQSGENTKANEFLFRRLTVEDAAEAHVVALAKAQAARLRHLHHLGDDAVLAGRLPRADGGRAVGGGALFPATIARTTPGAAGRCSTPSTASTTRARPSAAGLRLQDRLSATSLDPARPRVTASDSRRRTVVVMRRAGRAVEAWRGDRPWLGGAGGSVDAARAQGAGMRLILRLCWAARCVTCWPGWPSAARRWPSLSSPMSPRCPSDVALVLGTAPIGPEGGPNRYFVYRLDAAAALWKAGKVKYLLVSGNAATTTSRRRCAPA